MVTPLPRRRPWQLAKETTTLDRLSSGRLILGVGVGSPAHADFGLFGEPVGDRDRADLLDEGLDALALLWSGEVVSLRGRHFQFGPVRLLPRPVQRPRIPVWVAGILPAAKPLARAARWDGFVPIHRGRPAGLPSPEDIAAARRRIEQQRSTADGFDIAVWASLNSGGDGPRPDRSAYADAGATWWLDTVRAEPGWPELAWAQVQRA
jgi:alkanesulfonate monooxygenase SsuD/methylene tetrahydromethanopterin reductase-like flavin-dependent oxidoreductase (luciferase family)